MIRVDLRRTRRSRCLNLSVSEHTRIDSVRQLAFANLQQDVYAKHTASSVPASTAVSGSQYRLAPLYTKADTAVVLGTGVHQPLPREQSGTISLYMVYISYVYVYLERISGVAGPLLRIYENTA